VWPSLHSVLRGGIAFMWGLPVASGGPAVKWMLPLEPLSTCVVELPSSRARLSGAGAYALSLSTRCRFGSYTSPCFHIASTIAAILRARVSFARFGLIPEASIRW
jgi:hypothetical protein